MKSSLGVASTVWSLTLSELDHDHSTKSHEIFSSISSKIFEIDVSFGRDSVGGFKQIIFFRLKYKKEFFQILDLLKSFTYFVRREIISYLKIAKSLTEKSFQSSTIYQIVKSVLLLKVRMTVLPKLIGHMLETLGIQYITCLLVLNLFTRYKMPKIAFRKVKNIFKTLR